MRRNHIGGAHAVAAVALLAGAGPVRADTSTPAYRLDLVARQHQTVDGQRLDLFRGVSVNDAGDVAYTAVSVDSVTQELDGSAVIVNDRKIASRGEAIASGELGFLGEPDLGNNGSAVYSADVFATGAGLSNTGVVIGPTSSHTDHQLVVGRDTEVAGFRLDGAVNPTIGSGGSLAYTGIYFDPVLNLVGSAIVHDDAIVAATGDVVGDWVVDRVERPSLGRDDQLAFEAVLLNVTTAEPATAIFSDGALVALSGALTEDIRISDVYSASRSPRGDLAYVAAFADRGAGVNNTAVIVNGQVALESGAESSGGLILDAVFDIDLNAHGQIALLARLIDSASPDVFTEAVLLATPVPEPTAALLAIAALSSFGSARRGGVSRAP